MQTKITTRLVKQIVAEVLQIADETGWRGAEIPMRLEWERRGGSMI